MVGKSEVVESTLIDFFRFQPDLMMFIEKKKEVAMNSPFLLKMPI